MIPFGTMRNSIFIILISLILLNIGALFINIVWPESHRFFGFFYAKIRLLNYMPYWLAANICLIILNGVALIHNSAIRAQSTTGLGISGRLPFTSFIILGYNLIGIPILILFPRFINIS